MIAGLLRQAVGQAMGGALLRARMEARKAAFAAAAGLLALGALTLAGAAGIVEVSTRYGVIAGLLAGAALLLVLAVIVFLIGRRVPGADASARAVRAEALLEDTPAADAAVPQRTLRDEPSHDHVAGDGGLAALATARDAVRARLDGVLPPGGQGALAAAAASQLARRPAATLGAALAVGAVIGLVRGARGVPSAAATLDAPSTKPGSDDLAARPPAPRPAPRRRPAGRPDRGAKRSAPGARDA